MSNCITFLLSIAFVASFFTDTRSYALGEETYKIYKRDLAPLKKYPKLAKEFAAAMTVAESEPLSRKALRRNVSILEKVLKAHPKWLDGYWMVSGELFQLSATWDGSADLDESRKLLIKAIHYSETCLKLDPKHPLCKMGLGGSLAKVGTIDGVFASLKVASRVEDLWMDVLNSPYNYQYTKEISLQGAVRYALGIFYRLVPDVFVLKWMFGVQGDLDKSISFHRQTLSIDKKPYPCAYMMLGVSLLCRSDGVVPSADYKEGVRSLKMVAKLKPSTTTGQSCVRDAKRVLKDVDLSCGYSTSKQQEDPPPEEVIKAKPNESFIKPLK